MSVSENMRGLSQRDFLKVSGLFVGGAAVAQERRLAGRSIVS